MIFRIDLLATDNPKPTIEAWRNWQEGFRSEPDFINSDLSQVFRRLHRSGYDLVGINQWRDRAAYMTAQLRHAPNPLNPIAPNEANLYELVNRADKDGELPEPGDLIVTNPYRIPTEEGETNAAMWNESKNHMANQPGFVNARLYRQTNEQCDYYFVSQARWRSETDFMKQFEGKDFQNIIAAFEGKFTICFSTEVHQHQATEQEITA